MHVPFDGWSELTFRSAASDADVPEEARALFPAVRSTSRWPSTAAGDRQMADALKATDLDAMRFRDRVSHAVKLRLDLVEPHKEAVRRGVTLFALPMHAADGARALWETADTIWTALGDTSDDLNWYSKRAILSGVYSSTVLYWLGDQSAEHGATWAFLDRRIEDVMRFETVKKQVRENRLLGPAHGRAGLAGETGACAIRGHSARGPAGALARLSRVGALSCGKRHGKRFSGPSLADPREPGMPATPWQGKGGHHDRNMRAIEISEPGGPEVLTPTTPPGARAHGRADPDRRRPCRV
jgi:ubiquinone biosynthesis protein COQ9